MSRCPCAQNTACGGPCNQTVCSCEPIVRYNPYTPCPPPPLEYPIIFKAAAISNVALSASVPSPVSFPIAILANPNYSLITSTFSAPRAGSYSFTASVTWSTPYQTSMFTLTLQNNGVNTSFAVSTTSGAPGIYVTTVQGCLPLVLGDVVSVSALSTQNVSIVGSNPCPNPLTSFQGQLVC